MFDLILLVGSILAGALLVWSVSKLIGRREPDHRVSMTLQIRAQILHESVVNREPLPKNTAREVGEALFGPEEKSVK